MSLRRYRCPGCGYVRRQDFAAAAPARAKISGGGIRWALAGIACAHPGVARVAETPGVAWNTTNDAVLAEDHRVLISDLGRFDGVAVTGVAEHVWRHTRWGERYVTVIIDPTPSATT